MEKMQDSILGAYLDRLGAYSDEAQAVREMLGCGGTSSTQDSSSTEGSSNAEPSKPGM